MRKISPVITDVGDGRREPGASKFKHMGCSTIEPSLDFTPSRITVHCTCDFLKYRMLHKLACHPGSRDHASLLCIIPIIAYVLPKQAHVHDFKPVGL